MAATMISCFLEYIYIAILHPQWAVRCLIDNQPFASSFYLMTVYTSLRVGAGTTSKVGFILVGDKGDTGFRSLTDGQIKVSDGYVLSIWKANAKAASDIFF